ncbi:MAG TPA: amino acid permease [Blastocatellia bacterium]|nr:amino acid permease [Blastocatellia bacterium]
MISQIILAVTGRGTVYYVTIASVLAVLALSANTSFAGFPRLSCQIAEDGFLPKMFIAIGRRLVYSTGIIILAVLSGLLLIVFGGITDRLIPLFAVGAFGAFTLSQAGMVVHWKRTGGRGSQVRMAVNAMGAIATGVALMVILVAKFVEGAWITFLLVPFVLFIFYKVRSHYNDVAKQINVTKPLDLLNNEPPIVVVPIAELNAISEKALRFAIRLSDDVIALHVHRDGEDDSRLCKLWAEDIESPVRKCGFSQPRLEIIPSPYRQFIKPISAYVDKLRSENPERLIAVIVPNLIETRWYEHLMHNHRAEWLKAELTRRADRRVVVINIPWYLS